MNIARLNLTAVTLFFALSMPGDVWAQTRHIINGSAEFGWRVEDNKRATTAAGTTAGAAAVLNDNQLQSIVPGNAIPVDARSFDVSQPIVNGLGNALGRNFVGTPGVGLTNSLDGRNANVVPPINIPVLPSLVIPGIAK